MSNQQPLNSDPSRSPTFEALLATLPICSTGRVFIEIPDAAWQGDIVVPARMILTWLDRSQRSGAPGTGLGCGPGQAIARAVAAWADEMLCDEDDETRIHLLGGYLGTADIVDHLTTRNGVSPEAIHTPERFGLTTAR